MTLHGESVKNLCRSFFVLLVFLKIYHTNEVIVISGGLPGSRFLKEEEMIQMISGFLGSFSFDQIMQIVPTIVGLAFFGSAVNTLRIVVTAIGAGIGIWGIINLLEGYGQDNSGAKSQGIKQLIPSLMEGI